MMCRVLGWERGVTGRLEQRRNRCLRRTEWQEEQEELEEQEWQEEWWK